MLDATLLNLSGITIGKTNLLNQRGQPEIFHPLYDVQI